MPTRKEGKSAAVVEVIVSRDLRRGPVQLTEKFPQWKQDEVWITGLETNSQALNQNKEELQAQEVPSKGTWNSNPGSELYSFKMWLKS